MNSLAVALVEKFVVFFLVFVRMASLFVITPIFGRQNMPPYLKLGFAFICSYIIVPLLGEAVIPYNNIFDMSLLVAKEALVGIVLGYVSFLVFSSVYIAGQIIDMQIGFGMVNVLDPQMDIQVPLTGNFLYILTTIVFLMMDGHHILFSALFKSYKIIPLGGFAITEYVVNNIISVFCEVFIIGFKVSAPVLVAALLSEVALGILARTVPQMNVFVVGLPFKIAIGLGTVLFMLPVFIAFLNIAFDKMYNYIYLIIQSIAKG